MWIMGGDVLVFQLIEHTQSSRLGIRHGLVPIEVPIVSHDPGLIEHVKRKLKLRLEQEDDYGDNINDGRDNLQVIRSKYESTAMATGIVMDAPTTGSTRFPVKLNINRAIATAVGRRWTWLLESMPKFEFDVKVLRSVFSLRRNRSVFYSHAPVYWERRLAHLYPVWIRKWLLHLMCCATRAAKNGRVPRLPDEMWCCVLSRCVWFYLQHRS